MNKAHLFGVGVALSAISISCILLILQTSPYIKKEGMLNVVCTTSIVADAVRIIGGDHITLTCLMGPGLIHTPIEHENIVSMPWLLPI